MKYTGTLRSHLQVFEKLDYAKAHEAADDVLLDCSFGTNPFGHSSRVDPAALLAGVDVSQYPPFPYDDLKDALLAHWRGHADLTRAHLRVCAGSMLIVDAINSICLDAGDAVLGYSPQFPAYINSLRLRGGAYDPCPLEPGNHYRFSAADLVRKMERGGHKLVYLDNPNNPTGQIIDLAEIERVVQAAGRLGLCVIVDEAYGDYMPSANSAINLLDRHDNVFVVRSFSKGYALAGLRVGYLVASPELCSYYSLVDDLLVNPVGLGAAIASLADADYLPGIVARVARVKTQVMASLRTLTVPATDARVPIFVIQHPDPAVNLYDLLLSKGVRATSGFEGLGLHAVRLRIPIESARLVAVLQEIEAEL